MMQTRWLSRAALAAAALFAFQVIDPKAKARNPHPYF
jgi:hypothetical protein